MKKLILILLLSLGFISTVSAVHPPSTISAEEVEIENNIKRLKISIFIENCEGCDLREADLSGARLGKADLSRADLSRANLSGANLSGADLTGADLTGADLTGADLTGADLAGADFSNANLKGVNLAEVDFAEAIGIQEYIEKKIKKDASVAAMIKKKKVADAKKAEEKRIAEEEKRIAEEKRILRLKDYPGFKDLKPGLTYKEVLEICPLEKVSYWLKDDEKNESYWVRCYEINNIKFEACYFDDFLTKLSLDMGPIVETGGYLGIFGEGDSNIFIKMKNTFDKKYTLDYGYSERDRQLFNESEKSRLYRVYSKGQVALEINRKEKDYSYELWLYIHYLDSDSANEFLEKNRPVRASEDDF